MVKNAIFYKREYGLYFVIFFFFRKKKMCNHIKIHSLFLQYWKIVSKKEIDLGEFEVVIATSHVFCLLRTEWESNNLNLD